MVLLSPADRPAPGLRLTPGMSIVTVGRRAAPKAAGPAPAEAGAAGQAGGRAPDGLGAALAAGLAAAGLAEAEALKETLGFGAADDGCAETAGAADDGLATALGEAGGAGGLDAGAAAPPQAASSMLASTTQEPREMTLDAGLRFVTDSSS